MTLSLLLDSRPRTAKALLIADACTRRVEAVLAGLMSQRQTLQLVIFPSPGGSPRTWPAPPALMRSRHSDLWQALSSSERERVVLAAGATAAYLDPVMGTAASTLIAVSDPHDPQAPIGSPWQGALGPFSELDEVPEAVESEQQREEWLDRIRTATSGFVIVRDAGVADIIEQAAPAVGFGPKRTARAVAAADFSVDDVPTGRRRPAQWLDEALYDLSGPSRDGEAAP